MLNLLGSFVSVLSTIGYILLAILVLMIMIVIHELGHYTAGKIFKFKINEFSIGFGKAIFSKTLRSGEVFSIRLIPLGGYCAFEGEDKDGKTEGDFNSQAWWKRLIVLFSGAFFNFISAIIFSIFLLTFVSSGYSKVTNVNANEQGIIEGVVYEKEDLYLKANDVILRVNGTQTRFLNGGFSKLISDASNDGVIVLTVERVVDGKKVRLDVPVRKHAVDSEGKPVDTSQPGIKAAGYIVGIYTTNHTYSFGKSLYMSVPVTCQMGIDCLVTLGKLIIGQYSLRDIGGPLTTISTIASASQMNILNLLLLFPLIAVNLAVFNWLPIPALDGARMVFVIIEAIRRKPINRELEAKIHNVGLMILFGFVILVDILHLLIFRS